MWTKRLTLWRFMLCIFFTMSALAITAARADDVPSESQCRPYIEKALKELESGDAERDSVEKNDSSEVSVDDDTKEVHSAEDGGGGETAENVDSKEDDAPSVEVADQPYVSQVSVEAVELAGDNDSKEDATVEENDNDSAEKADDDDDSKQDDGDSKEEASAEEQASEQHTEDLYTIGFQKVASRYGKEFTFELKCKIMGQQSREFAASIIGELDLQISVEEFLSQTRNIFRELFPQCQIMPGVERLIRHFHANKIPIGLATSSSKETYDLKVSNHQELFNLLRYKTWGSSDPDVKRGKPHPDIFLVAAAKFLDNPAPGKCLVFEDSINGVKAARAAGMQVVMVPDPRLQKALTTDATLVIDSMEDFQPELFGLPPYTN